MEKGKQLVLRYHHTVCFAFKLTQKYKPNCLTFLPMQTLIPPLSLFFSSVFPNCCFLFQEISAQW